MNPVITITLTDHTAQGEQIQFQQQFCYSQRHTGPNGSSIAERTIDQLAERIRVRLSQQPKGVLCTDGKVRVRR